VVQIHSPRPIFSFVPFPRHIERECELLRACVHSPRDGEELENPGPSKHTKDRAPAKTTLLPLYLRTHIVSIATERSLAEKCARVGHPATTVEESEDRTNRESHRVCREGLLSHFAYATQHCIPLK
jgi:hypothetical protein